MAAEKNFENKVKEYLEESGAWHIKYWGGAKYTKSGIPDILVCLNGCFLAIETKAPTGKPTPLQLHSIKKIREAGGIAIVLYPEQWDMFRDMVKSINLVRFDYEDYQYEFDNKLSDEDKERLYGKNKSTDY